MKLNDTKCRTAKPHDPPKKTPRKLADGQGLYLWVMPNESKYWRFTYRFNGKQTDLALGVYPEVTLAEAREKRAEARKMLKLGLNPSQVRQKQKMQSQESSENTFQKMAEAWYENRKSRWTPTYADSVWRRLEQDILPEIGHFPIKDIEPPMLLHVIRKIEDRGAPEVARRQLQKCGEIFAFARSEGKIPATYNPTADLPIALKPIKTGHYASFDIKELPEFIDAIERNDARLYKNTRNALKLMMLTFVRTSELINAKWSEIDLKRKEWIIPAERMKMGKEHFVPLSDQAIEILLDQREFANKWDWVFPSTVKPSKSMSNNTILGAIKRLGYKGRMTGHGFRALAMGGIKQELGYRHEVVDRQLAHKPKNKVDQAYDRAGFEEERKVMMQEWADYIDSISGRGTVVNGDFKRAKV